MSFLKTKLFHIDALVKNLPLLHPDEVPATMEHIPSDFHAYEYVGTAIETITHKKMDGTIARHPALVVRLVLKNHLDDGASAEVEMTCSLRDLENGHHPHLRKAGAALYAHYKTRTHGADAKKSDVLGDRGRSLYANLNRKA